MTDSSSSWSVWFQQHGATLVLFACQWVPSRADAEDVVQEAFIRFWRLRHQVSDPAAYLYTCVRSCAMDWRRSRQRQLSREWSQPWSEKEAWLEGAAEREERRTAIEAALRQIPVEQAEVLIMRIWGGLKFPQIAAALQISPNTAASRYRYAMLKLRDRLAEEQFR